MTARFRGFATLTALALLLFLVTYLSLSVAGSSQSALSLSRAEKLGSSRNDAWAKLDDALGRVTSSWHPDSQRFSDWAAANPQEGVTWTALSGRVNLNTVTPFLMALPGFQQTFSKGSVEQFVAERAKRGPVADLEVYAVEFSPKSVGLWYTTHSLWNPNTADEVTLEAMVTARTQSSTLGSAVRAQVRAFREQKRRFTQASWQSALAGQAEPLKALITFEPELDVNEMAPELLVTLLSNPDWAVPDPVAKANAIVTARTGVPWSVDRLKDLLKLPVDHIAFSYLGSTTHFLDVTVNVPGGQLVATIFVESDPGQPMHARIVSTHWTAS